MILEFTCNGYLKNGYEEITYTLQLDVENDYHNYFKELLQKDELTAKHSNNTIVIALRELSWFKNIIFRHVIAIKEIHTCYYLVMLEWLTEDDNGLDFYLYKDYNADKNKYKQLIKDENDADISWVGSEVFNENGEVNEGYELECSKVTEKGQDLYWKVTDLNKSNVFSMITLTKIKTL